MRIDRFKTFESDNPLNDSEENVKGLIAYVYRNASKSFSKTAAGGITENYEKVVVVGPGIPSKFSPASDMPAVRLDKIGKWVIARPVDVKPGSEGTYMFGGNFIYSSDSSFSALNNGHPIPVHDRFEDWGTYDAMSR
jgi:hypothetical protein